jgi:ribonuclease Z
MKWQGEDLEAVILYSEAGVATQILIKAGQDYLLVDIGDGTLRDLRLQEIDFHRLKGILLTHGHFDHIGGLYALMGHLRVIGRKEPLSICFPQGCREAHQILAAFQESYKDIPFEIRTQEVRDGGRFQLGEVEVEARLVVHYGSTKIGGLLSQDPAVGYRLTYRGQVIAISGDTGVCSGLMELVKGADLALIEATLEEAAEELQTKLHLSKEKAEEIGQQAKEYLLIHQKRE